MPAGAIPYWRLSSFYFFYFAVVGTMLPFLGLYLQSLNFSPADIGAIAALLMATRIVAPNIWGWLCDRSGRRLTIIRLGCFLACLCFVALLWQRTFWWVALVVVAYSFFWNAVLAQFEVVTLSHLEGRSHFYSRVRLWGSVGFIVVVVLLGRFFDIWSIKIFPQVGMLFLVLLWFSSLSIKDKPLRFSNHEGAGLIATVVQRPVFCFLLSSFLLQVSHGAYYTFYSVFLDSLGYSRTAIGGLWALGVMAEVLVFWCMHRVMRRYTPRDILLLSLVLTVVRWWLIGCYADSAPVLLFAQLLHAFSFGTAHAVAIELVRRYFHGRIQGQGQALYSAVSFGAGGAVGALISGYVWSQSPLLAFAISALAAAVALLLVWWGMRGAAAHS